jgi:hypothetical protein
MAIRAKLQDLQVLIDFGAPVVNMGVGFQQFEVTSTSVIGATFAGDQYCTLTLGATPPDGELWLYYTAQSQGAQILKLTTPSEAVKSFEVLITESKVPDAQQYNVANTTERPCLGDFIEAYTLKEAIDITNSSPNATQPDELKFIRAIEDAEALWNQTVLTSSMSSQILLAPGKRRALLTIARYYLDQAGCPRPHVTAAYTSLLNQISSTTGGIGTDPYIGDDGDFFWYSDNPCQGCGCPGLNPKPSMYQDPWLR